MDLYLLSNARVFYNSARGGVFMWSLLSGLALSWVIFMFLKKRMGEGKGKGDVYKGEGKEEQTENEIKNREEGRVEKDKGEENQYEASENKENEEKKSDIVASAPKSEKVEKEAPNPEDDSRGTLEKILDVFEEFLFLYAPFFCINILNIICVRTWEFNLVVWFLVLLAVIPLNLLGLFTKLENKFLQCLLKSVWVLLGVMWYINFFTIKYPIITITLP